MCDLLTIAGVIVLNLALYELLAPVDRPLARLAALKRLLFWSDAKMTKLPASATDKLTAPFEPL